MPYKNAYQQALLEARKAALSGGGIPRRAYDLLIQVFGRAIVDIDRDLGTGRITSERAEALRRQINRRIIELGRRLGILLDDQKQSMIRAAIAGHEQGILRATEITGVSVAVNFDAIPDRALQTMMLRRGLFGAEDYKAVINRGLVGMADDIDQYIGSAVARGVNSRTASQELAAMLSRGNDDILKYVEEGRLTRSAINNALRDGELNLEQYQQARSMFYDSRRIMVTETNNAFREADRLSQQESPIVGATKWQVSGRHYGLPSSPDICTIYHEYDLFGMGEGVFPTQNFPAPPHPYCGCYAMAVIRDVELWNTPKQALTQPPELTEEQFSSMFEDATPRKLETQVEEANKYLKLAYEVSTRSAAA
jgi:hypothetical protein